MYMCSHLWTFLVFIQKIIFWLADLFNKRVVAVWIALQICTSWYLWLPTIIRKKTFEMTTDRSYMYYLDKSVKGKKYHIDPGNLFKPFPNSQGHIISFLSIIFLIEQKSVEYLVMSLPIVLYLKSLFATEGNMISILFLFIYFVSELNFKIIHSSSAIPLTFYSL